MYNLAKTIRVCKWETNFVGMINTTEIALFGKMHNEILHKSYAPSTFVCRGIACRWSHKSVVPNFQIFRFASFGEHLACWFYGWRWAGRKMEGRKSTAVIHNSELHITAKSLKSAVSYNFDIYLQFLPRKWHKGNEMRAISVCQALCIRFPTYSGDIHDRQPV